MEYKFINHLDPILENVIALGKKNSSTLGLMPRDAYLDQARKKCIVVALHEGNLAGYCLFRLTTSKNRIGITQVCIGEVFRKQGIPKLLLDLIQDKFKYQFSGMLLSCREDYSNACKLWESYGFVKLKRIRSRSKEQKYLIKFWFDFGQQNLFSLDDNNTNLKVVLDLNILIKLLEDKANEEVSSLLSDWLTDEVDYFYAKETLNEIHRDNDHTRANNTLQFLNNFRALSCSAKESQKYIPQLETIHPGKSQNHISDRKQLSECITCKIEYFITVDDEILNRREVILRCI